MLKRWKTRLVLTAAIALSCLVAWRKIEGRASQRIWEELTAELDIISLSLTPSTSTEWLISDPAGGDDQIGQCRMKNGEVWSFAFRSHHLMSGRESMAVFRGPQDTIQLVGDYFCCEVMLPFGQPASGAEFIRQLQSLPMTQAHRVVGMHAVVAETPDLEQTRADFEKLAAQLPYLAMESVLYDRPNHSFEVADPKKREEHFRILNQATDRKYAKDALLNLLGDRDAKTRTLAAVALFDREDPSILPALVRLCDDGTASFDGHGELSASWAALTSIGPPPQKQTVADIASEMVGFYMERSGYHYGVKHSSQPGFVAYWEARKNRSHCAAWFAVQLARANRGTMSTQKDCLERIRAVRARIDELPAVEGSWVLLWLNGEGGSDALATDQELVNACKRLGADNLLLRLQNKIPSDDPDLHPRPINNWPYNRMSLYILRHADQLLRRDDSDTLLTCEQWWRDLRNHGISDPTISAWWAVAAARLSPDRASPILRGAMQRFQRKYDSAERSTLCVAMWQLAGERESAYVLDWFYDDTPNYGAFPHSRGSFIEAMGKEPNGMELICQLIMDRRLNNLDWQSLERLVRVVNAWSETPIVTEEELRKAWHPAGQGNYDRPEVEAAQKYPKETADLRAHLSEWRERLRMSTPNLLRVETERRKGNVESSGPANATPPRR